MSQPAAPPASASELTPPDPQWVERFRADLEAASACAPEDKIALAVSGGPDSMAMLALAAAAFPGRAVAATVDHRLRPEAANEAKMVAAYCAQISVEHRILVPKKRIFGASIQASARKVRYDLLADWALMEGASLLATAHHADDQAETFLMRARRGSGPAGLAGIRRRWSWENHRWHRGYPKGGVVAVADVTAISIVRPLLDWDRATLRAVVETSAIPFVDDPSNDDERFDRVRMRALLAENPWLEPAALARSAAICAEVDADLNAMMDWLSRDRRRESDTVWRRIDVAGLPRELRRRLARDAIDYVRTIGAVSEGRWSAATNIEHLLNALDAGSSATQAGVIASADGDVWTFAPAPPRRSL